MVSKTRIEVIMQNASAKGLCSPHEATCILNSLSFAYLIVEGHNTGDRQAYIERYGLLGVEELGLITDSK